MNSFSSKSICLLFLFYLLFIHNSGAQSMRLVNTLEWHQSGHMILTPAFNPANSEIAFVKMPQSDTAFTTQLHTVKKSFLKDTAGKSLLPIITLLHTKTGHLSLLDYGWTPDFSPNGQQLVYVCQKGLITGSSQLKSNLKDNELQLFDARTQSFQTLLTPQQNLLLSPNFLDTSNILYKTGDAISGQYSAGIGFNSIHSLTKKTTTFQMPRITHRLYDIMGEPYLYKNKLAYTVYSPQDSGYAGMASEYRHLLMSGKDTVQDFGIRKFTSLENQFAITASGDILFLDNNKLLVEDTSYLVTYRKGDIVSRRPLPEHFEKGFMSPGGQYFVYMATNKVVYLVNSATLQSRTVPLPSTNLYTVVWSKNEKKLMLVQEHPSIANTDALYVFELTSF